MRTRPETCRVYAHSSLVGAAAAEARLLCYLPATGSLNATGSLDAEVEHLTEQKQLSALIVLSNCRTSLTRQCDWSDVQATACWRKQRARFQAPQECLACNWWAASTQTTAATGEGQVDDGAGKGGCHSGSGLQCRGGEFMPS